MAKQEIFANDALESEINGNPASNITGTTIGTKRAMDVTSLGSGAITDVNGSPINWTTVTLVETSTTIDTFTYSNSGGDLVIYTVTYTDATHDVLSTVVKTAP